MFKLIEQGLFDAGVPREQCEACLAWAIGEDWQTVRLSEIDVRVRRVGLDIPGHTTVPKAFEIIGKAYLRRTDNGEMCNEQEQDEDERQDAHEDEGQEGRQGRETQVA